MLIQLSYIFIGLICIAFVVVIFLAVRLVKDARYGGSFYFFSRHSLVADILCLLVIGPYAGLLLAFGSKDTLPLCQKLVGAVFFMSWILKGWFLVLTALTRFSSFKRMTLRFQKTTTGQKVLCFGLWISIMLISLVSFLFCPALSLSFKSFTFSFDDDPLNTCKVFWRSFFYVNNGVAVLTIFVLNLSSLFLYVNKKNTVIGIVFTGQTAAQQAKKARREKLFFVMCVVYASFYLIICCIASIFARFEQSTTGQNFGFLVHLTGFCTFIDTSIAYLFVNKELRRQAKNLIVKNITQLVSTTVQGQGS